MTQESKKDWTEKYEPDMELKPGYNFSRALGIALEDAKKRYGESVPFFFGLDRQTLAWSKASVAFDQEDTCYIVVLVGEVENDPDNKLLLEYSVTQDFCVLPGFPMLKKVPWWFKFVKRP